MIRACRFPHRFGFSGPLESFVETLIYEAPEGGMPIELENMGFCDSFLDSFGDLIDSHTLHQQQNHGSKSHAPDSNKPDLGVHITDRHVRATFGRYFE